MNGCSEVGLGAAGVRVGGFRDGLCALLNCGMRLLRNLITLSSLGIERF
jgi:hypothetical protein